MSVDRMAPTRLAGRYVLRELIASGGMGEVHLATDERLGRQVAVKVLSRALTDSPESVERFRREALAAAGLSHPNVARVYDYGVEGESHFIVMEHLEGRSLDRLLRDRGSLAPDEAVAIASQVCAALGAAHRAGIVHRDVKPGNVMVAPDGTVKVTDFGISKALGASPLTDTGTILGTAAYLPPEVGRGASAGPKSDLYSLGIVLYQMLTGHAPFAAESPVAVAMRHVSEDVPAPSGVVPGLPAFLDDVVARATRRDPDERFASAEAMGEALQGRDTQPILEVAPEPTQPMTRAMAVPAPPHEDAPHSTTRALPIPAPDREHDPSDREHNPHDRKHNPHDRKHTGRRRGALIALAAALLIGLGALGTSLLSSGDQSPTATTPPSSVPSSTASPTSSQPSTTAAPAGVVPAGLVGSDLASAEAALKRAGLSYRWRMVASDAPRNQVIEATPAAGTAVQPGQPVMLTISRGPATATTTSQNDNAGNNNGNGNSNGASGKAKGRDKGKGH